MRLAMRELHLLIILVLLAGQARANLSASAGAVLLDSFRCDSTNTTAVQEVRNSLANLNSTVEKIVAQQRDCQADLAAVGQLPEIGSILRQIENHGAAEEIRKQETIITEALNDLAMIQRLPVGHPNRALYPDEAMLQSIVANARSQLYQFRATGAVEAARADRRRYIDGVNQMNDLSRGLAESLRRNSPCLQRNPLLRRQILTGLVGIAGFFAKTPAGIGVTLSARVLQNVFDIGDSSALASNKQFESSHQALLVAGLACTMENLSSQHCRLVRQEQLQEQAASGVCSGSQCSQGTRDYANLVESGQRAARAYSEVSTQMASRAGDRTEQAQARIIGSAFLAAASEFESSLSNIAQTARVSQNSSFAESQRREQRRSVLQAISAYSERVYGSGNMANNVRGMGMGGGGNQASGADLLGALFSEQERTQSWLQMTLNNDEINSYQSEAQAELRASAQLRQRYGLEGIGGVAGPRTERESVRSILNEAFDMATNLEQLTPSARRLRAHLESPAVLERMNSRLSEHRNRIVQRTALPQGDQELARFMTVFLREEIGRPSVLKHLESIRDFFGSLPQDFVRDRGQMMGIERLRDEVNSVIELGSAIDSRRVPMDSKNSAELLTRVNMLLDPHRRFSDQVADVASAASSYQAQMLIRQGANSQDLSSLIFLQSREFLTGVYGTSNFAEALSGTRTAISISASQIDSFGRFFEGYMEPAFRFLNRRDVQGNQFNDGLAENVHRNLKDHFCIQSLGLTNLSSDVRRECAGATLRMGGNILRFADFERAPHQERVCAYRNFINRIDRDRSQRSEPPPQRSTR